MRTDHARHLREASIPTRAALATTPPGTDVAGVGAGAFERLRHQAELQVRGDGCVSPLFDLLEPEVPGESGPYRGFAALPAPSEGDLFLDLEGDPYALDGGLEYLFGIVESIDGEPRYPAYWAHDRAQEKQAFEAVVDFVTERRARTPGLHVYHYASYEPSALRRLMGTHGTREAALDDLLRGEVFVDLYAVVRNAIRCSTESYSLKAVESLYMTRPAGAVMDAGSSIVAYERYLEERDATVLDEIAAYNEDDCVSTLGLRDWLEERRVEAEARWGPIPRRPEPTEATPEELTAREADLAALAERLTAGVPDDQAARSTEQQAMWLLAQMLHWHRREEKPQWWAYFHRIHDLAGDDFVADPECIGNLLLEREVGALKRSMVYRYGFEPQDHKFSTGDAPVDPATGSGAGTITDLGDDWLELKRGPKLDGVAHPTALIPGGPFDTKVQRAAIRAIAEWVAEHGIDAPGAHRAARDVLLARPPRLRAHSAGTSIAGGGESSLDAACRVVFDLDDGCLPVQGPPGAGKTFTGAHMIVKLLDAGRRVGITAYTHSAIGNLLDEVCKVAAEQDVEVRAIQRSDDEQRHAPDAVEVTTSNDRVDAALAGGEVQLVAGTSWLWCREQMRDAVDVLVVDEAGQISLANVLAVSVAASNLVLLGDPQQLAQPSQAAHPEGAGVSALEHLLAGHETIPPERGLFLDATYRMHPAVCAFVSEIAYENRLHAAPGCESQADDAWAGLRFVPVTHEHNRVRSPEEAAAVAELVTGLVGRPWTDHLGDTEPLTLDKVIVVAPYNAHVAELHRALPRGTRVGTVDKFQGREGAVAIYSMASSSADDAPRGMTFLYDLHRFNVAVSRARAIGVVVCSPELLRVLCHTPEQMRLANALCRFAELAESHKGAGNARAELSRTSESLGS